MRTSGPRNYLNERRVRHINNNTAVHSAGGEVTVGEPQQSQSGRYLYIDARA